ncbi:hypothetical protein VIGAN_02215000, partial [Vigna angularis var. angularis]
PPLCFVLHGSHITHTNFVSSSHDTPHFYSLFLIFFYMVHTTLTHFNNFFSPTLCLFICMCAPFIIKEDTRSKTPLITSKQEIFRCNSLSHTCT